MNQYLITAYDYTDTEALPRRMAVRQAHLDGARQLKEAGHLLLGGAILDDYIRQGVWEKVEIKPFRTATVQ
jgi:hypothetical protein